MAWPDNDAEAIDCRLLRHVDFTTQGVGQDYMKHTVKLLVLSLAAASLWANDGHATDVPDAGAGKPATVVNFDDTPSGELPKGWTSGVTGSGSPKWEVIEEKSAPSQTKVLAQTGEGTYPFCVASGVAMDDGFVEVKFKPVSGSEDQAGGLIWRFKDKDDYYITRANALENNVTIYHTIKGVRRSFKSVDMSVSGNTWHTLRAEFKGSNFTVLFDGQKALEAEDSSLEGSGAVGVWTKADSETYFDDFRYGSSGK